MCCVVAIVHCATLLLLVLCIVFSLLRSESPPCRFSASARTAALCIATMSAAKTEEPLSPAPLRVPSAASLYPVILPWPYFQIQVTLPESKVPAFEKSLRESSYSRFVRYGGGYIASPAIRSCGHIPHRHIPRPHPLPP